MGDFREHGVMLYLDRELYSAFIKLQADKNLGRSYAGLLPLTEGLYRLGYVTKDVYERHFTKYSEGLGKEPATQEQLDEQQVLKEKGKLFSRILEQWHEHPSHKWRQTWIREAERFSKVPNAKLILDLAKGETAT
jgi:hypothetical protein